MVVGGSRLTSPKGRATDFEGSRVSRGRAAAASNFEGRCILRERLKRVLHSTAWCLYSTWQQWESKAYLVMGRVVPEIRVFGFRKKLHGGEQRFFFQYIFLVLFDDFSKYGVHSLFKNRKWDLSIAWVLMMVLSNDSTKFEPF